MAFHVKTMQREAYSWHVQDKKPRLEAIQSPYHSGGVDFFQADGDELLLIQVRLQNVPITLGGTCTWRGEMAQFIYDNL